MHYREEYLPFINNSGYFYTNSQVNKIKQFKIALPTNWKKTSDDHWTCCLYLKKKIPFQGWKIHVSSDYCHEQEILNLVGAYLFSKKINFKFTKNEEEWIWKNSKNAPRSASGKFITIYPQNDQEFVNTIKDLAKLLRSYKECPFILSDREWQDTCIYYRYGAFQKIEQQRNGKTIYCIYTPDGKKIEDKRVPYYIKPNFVIEPQFIQKNNFMTKGANTNKLSQFKIQEALKFSNSGGVYLGNINSATYVLKEGRPFAGVDGNLIDGFTRVERESKFLKRLSNVNEVVGFKDYFLAWKHNYLVEEHLDGKTLTDYISENYPFNNQDKRNDYVNKAIEIAKKIIIAVKKIHAQGVAIGDLQPENIMILNNNLDIKLLDFEQAHNLSDRYRPGLITPGFANKKASNYEQADWYATYSTIRYLFLPIIDVRKFSSQVEFIQNKNLSKYFSKKASDFLEEVRKYGGFNYSNYVPSNRNLYDIISKLENGIVKNLDFTSNSLIKGDIDNFLDPQSCFSVGKGGLGLGLLLSRTKLCENLKLKRKFWDWIDQHQTDIKNLIRQKVGLFNGAAGIGSVLYELGYKKKGREIIQRLDANSSDDLSIESGLSGIGLAKLALYQVEKDLEEKRKVARIAYRVIDDFENQKHNGLINGKLGSILFLWETGLLLNKRPIEQTALNYLDELLKKNISKGKDHQIYIQDYILGRIRNLPYLNDGTVGLLLVLLEITKNDRKLRFKYGKTISAAIATNDVYASYMNGLFDGFSGLILADIAITANRFSEAKRLNEKVNIFCNYVFKNKDQILTPNSYGYKCSMDLQTGSIGDLLVLFGIKNNDWSLWLPIIKNKDSKIFKL